MLQLEPVGVGAAPTHVSKQTAYLKVLRFRTPRGAYLYPNQMLRNGQRLFVRRGLFGPSSRGPSGRLKPSTVVSGGGGCQDPIREGGGGGCRPPPPGREGCKRQDNAPRGRTTQGTAGRLGAARTGHAAEHPAGGRPVDLHVPLPGGRPRPVDNPAAVGTGESSAANNKIEC